MPNEFIYRLTSNEDQVLLDMITFFEDCGLPDNINSDDYESFCNKFFANV